MYIILIDLIIIRSGLLLSKNKQIQCGLTQMTQMTQIQQIQYNTIRKNK